jgi:SSS family solute:Na+ symporter/sodium/pantothenate symporter
MTPPENGKAILRLDAPTSKETAIPKGTWFKRSGEAYRLAELALIPAGQLSSFETAVLRITTPQEIERIASDDAARGIALDVTEMTPYQAGAGKTGVYVRNPGPNSTSGFGFLAVGTAISFFIFWPFAGTGQPSNMVRLMSFKDTPTLRYSIVTVAIYYSIIYFSLVVIFCCGRVLMSGMEIDPDRTMPELAAQLTRTAGMPWLAGLLVAAPFAAVMSSVDSFLLLVSSAVVRDVYQGHIDPAAPERRMKWLSYGVTVTVGILAVLCVLNPPTYLQDLIIFASGGLAACFLVPMVLALYWRRMTAAGAIAGMIGGTLVHLGLTCWGYHEQGAFRAYEFRGLNPFIWDLLGSAAAAILCAKFGQPNEYLVHKFFYRKKS